MYKMPLDDLDTFNLRPYTNWGFVVNLIKGSVKNR